MGNNQENYPYKRLGRYLRQLRVNKHESIDEVSGAVEMDASKLTEIELGAKRPSEDILLLLISHFEVKEEEAVKLWELSKFDSNELPVSSESNNELVKKTTAIVSSEEIKISYTDMVHVAVNNYGVVVNFMQSSGVDSQPMIVSRVGMSKEHAKSLIDVLKKTVELNEQKHISSSEAKKDKQQ